MNALLIIDPQIDFCPGGALAVADGDVIMPVINNRMNDFDTIILTQDWHPAGHSSFASSHQDAAPFTSMMMLYGDQVLWPDHCIAGTTGAQFHPDLMSDRARAIIRKGHNRAVDSYSAFFENDHKTVTGLDGLLRDLGCKTLTMMGLATDFCVAWSAIDGVALGYDVTIELAGCRAIDLDGSLHNARKDMIAAGVTIIE